MLHILLLLHANLSEKNKCAKLGNLPRNNALSEFGGELIRKLLSAFLNLMFPGPCIFIYSNK
jgi:hypothetical protein